MQQVEAGSKPLDGRRIRAQQSRRRIVEAMLEMVGSGEVSPCAHEVARRAGVGLRTVFRHFDDMDSLYREMAEAMEDEILPIIDMPFISDDWRERIFELIERRARMFEKLMPFKIAAGVHRHRSAFLRKDHSRLTSLQRAALETAIPARIRTNRALFEALELVLSFDTWVRLRREQGLSVAQARRTMEFAAGALMSKSENDSTPRSCALERRTGDHITKHNPPRRS